MRRLNSFIVLLLLPASNLAFAGVTDLLCATTNQSAARLICDHPILAKAYRKISQQQQTLLSQGKLSPEQLRAWQAKRDSCGNVACLDQTFASWKSTPLDVPVQKQDTVIAVAGDRLIKAAPVAAVVAAAPAIVVQEARSNRAVDHTARHTERRAARRHHPRRAPRHYSRPQHLQHHGKARRAHRVISRPAVVASRINDRANVIANKAVAGVAPLTAAVAATTGAVSLSALSSLVASTASSVRATTSDLAASVTAATSEALAATSPLATPQSAASAITGALNGRSVAHDASALVSSTASNAVGAVGAIGAVGASIASIATSAVSAVNSVQPPLGTNGWTITAVIGAIVAGILGFTLWRGRKNNFDS